MNCDSNLEICIFIPFGRLFYRFSKNAPTSFEIFITSAVWDLDIWIATDGWPFASKKLLFDLLSIVTFAISEILIWFQLSSREIIIFIKSSGVVHWRFIVMGNFKYSDSTLPVGYSTFSVLILFPIPYRQRWYYGQPVVHAWAIYSSISLGSLRYLQIQHLLLQRIYLINIGSDSWEFPFMSLEDYRKICIIRKAVVYSADSIANIVYSII